MLQCRVVHTTALWNFQYSRFPNLDRALPRFILNIGHWSNASVKTVISDYRELHRCYYHYINLHRCAVRFHTYFSSFMTSRHQSPSKQWFLLNRHWTTGNANRICEKCGTGTFALPLYENQYLQGWGMHRHWRSVILRTGQGEIDGAVRYHNLNI